MACNNYLQEAYLEKKNKHFEKHFVIKIMWLCKKNVSVFMPPQLNLRSSQPAGYCSNNSQSDIFSQSAVYCQTL